MPNDETSAPFALCEALHADAQPVDFSTEKFRLSW
jgi:hypothetical protein